MEARHVTTGTPRPAGGSARTPRLTRLSRTALALAALAVASLALAASADAFVYWSNFSGTIGRADLDGDPASVDQSFITGVSFPQDLAVDGTHLYWNSGTIGRADLDGDPGSVNNNFISDISFGFGVGVDGAHVYWTDNFGGGIERGDLGGDPASVNGLITGLPAVCCLIGPFDVAADGAHVYWTNDATNTIGRADLDGDPASVENSFIATASFPTGVAVDGAHVYWANLGTNTIGRADLDGNPASVNNGFITGANAPGGVAVDGGHVYWANSNGTIGRADLNGDPASVDNSFITGLTGTPTGVAVDGLGVEPPPTIGHLMGSVEALDLQAGIENALLAKLKAAQRNLTAGDTAEACGALGAFISQVRAQRGKKIRTADADALIAEAQALLAAVDCS